MLLACDHHLLRGIALFVTNAEAMPIVRASITDEAACSTPPSPDRRTIGWRNAQSLILGPVHSYGFARLSSSLSSGAASAISTSSTSAGISATMTASASSATRSVRRSALTS